MTKEKGGTVTNVKTDFNRCWVPQLQVEERPRSEQEQDQDLAEQDVAKESDQLEQQMMYHLKDKHRRPGDMMLPKPKRRRRSDQDSNQGQGIKYGKIDSVLGGKHLEKSLIIN